MCNISLLSNGTGSQHPDEDGDGGQDRSFLVGRGGREKQRPWPSGAPHSPGDLDRKEGTSVFLGHFHQQIIQQT